MPVVLLTVLTPDRQWFKSAQGTTLSQTPVEWSFCVQTCREGRPLVLPDLDQHPVYRTSAVVCGEPHVRFYAGVPLRSPGGERIGTLCLLDLVSRDFSAQDQVLLEDLAALAEAELAVSSWSPGELSLLAENTGVQRQQLLDAQTQTWGESAILDLLLREQRWSQAHSRRLSLILLESEAQELREKAQHLRRLLAPHQALGRWGLGDWLVLVPEWEMGQVVALSQRLAQAIGAQARVCVAPSGEVGVQDLRDFLLKQKQATASSGNWLEFRSFGSFQFLRRGEVVSDSRFRSVKNRLLLAYLLGASQKRVSEDALIEEFWPQGGESARNSLRASLSTLRGLLRPAESQLDPLPRESGWVGLAPELPMVSDLDLFWAGYSAHGEEGWKQALEAYQAPYLEGVYADWALIRRERLQESYLQVSLHFANALFSRADFEGVIVCLIPTLQLAPDRQDLYALLFRAYLRCARPETVIRKYRQLETELRQDYGVEPSLELLELYHRAELGLSCAGGSGPALNS